MLTQAYGVVTRHLDENSAGAQYLHVETDAHETRQAINLSYLLGPVQVGDPVLLNTTAQGLKLGTGGYDYVMAILDKRPLANTPAPGHIMKARYLPCQHSVLTLEEQPRYADIWERTLDNFPVLVGQLHSQIAPAAAGLFLKGRARIAYIMTDAASLTLTFSRLVPALRAAGLLHATFTCGQASGGDYETVTLHSALLAAKHIAACDAAIVCQGPGNAGTATKYGFSGMEQAANLDTAKALGGQPVAIVRMSDTDPRERHRGISHHTRTTLDMAYSRCIVPVPADAAIDGLPPGHDIRDVPGTQSALDLLQQRGVSVTSMGRSPLQDPLFFHAAAAAGLVTL